jgi:hypothetical protein
MLITKILAATVLTITILSPHAYAADSSSSATLQLSLGSNAIANKGSLPSETFSAPAAKTDTATKRFNQARALLSGLVSFKYGKGQHLKANFGRTSYSVQYISTF